MTEPQPAPTLTAEDDDHPQMRPDEATTPDTALAYMLQTHLCYSHIAPGDLAFRVLAERLAATGFRLSPSQPVPSGLDEAWKATEDALPEGWDFGLTRTDEDGPIRVRASAAPIARLGGVYVVEDTPVAALRALTARLATTAPPAEGRSKVMKIGA